MEAQQNKEKLISTLKTEINQWEAKYTKATAAMQSQQVHSSKVANASIRKNWKD
jgi:hypothetical protein